MSQSLRASYLPYHKLQDPGNRGQVPTLEEEGLTSCLRRGLDTNTDSSQ